MSTTQKAPPRGAPTRAQRRRDERSGKAPPVSEPVAPTPPSRGRRIVFTVLTILLPFLLLGAVELGLRVFWTAGALPLFITTEATGPDALVANPRVAHRWFSGIGTPPGTIPEPFAAHKPAHGLRIFALGESTTAGFPYPRNGAFSRVLADALRDAMPNDTVEVVNLGIPATNTYSLVDMADEVIAQHPDAVVIYTGHNEYYGALGAASTQSVLGGHPALVRAYLLLERLRIVYGLRELLAGARSAFGLRGNTDAPSFMELLARDQQIALDGPAYQRGVAQLESNLRVLLRKYRDAGVRVFIASQASNLADQPPFASAANGPADSAYASARVALARGDTTAARAGFTRARDLDVVRFRAPSAFNDVIRRVAAAEGATYVPVAENFARESPGGIPGRNLFVEHLHPNERGATLIAESFFDALAQAKFVGHAGDLSLVRPWDQYTQRMALSAFDERIVEHSRQTLLHRWPFVDAQRQSDYRSTYRPSGFADSLALLVAAGASWTDAKMQLAEWYEQRHQPDSAAVELRGVVRDAPEFAAPWESLGRALMDAHEDDSASAAFDHAMALGGSPAAFASAGVLAVRRKQYPRAISLLQRSQDLRPNDPPVLYQLSLAYALSGDFVRARLVAIRLYQVAPSYPGLARWMQLLGPGAH